MLLENIARQLRQKTGDLRYHAKGKSEKKLSQLLLGAITRPTRMLINPIIIGTSIYMAVMYGIIYLLFTTFSVVFQRNYGFREGIAGLAYLGIGVGSALGMFLFGRYIDGIYNLLTAKHQKAKPESVLRSIFLSNRLVFFQISITAIDTQCNFHAHRTHNLRLDCTV